MIFCDFWVSLNIFKQCRYNNGTFSISEFFKQLTNLYLFICYGVKLQ